MGHRCDRELPLPGAPRTAGGRQGVPLQDVAFGRVFPAGNDGFGHCRLALVFELGVAPPSARISASDKRRHLPIGNSPMRTGPIARRTSFNTLLPMASIMRRT